MKKLRTSVLIAAFERQLNHGAGDLTPELEEVAIDIRRVERVNMLEALRFVRVALDPALRAMTADGWSSVKVTQHYLDRYKGKHPSHPDTDVEIARAVAGRGRGQRTMAVHFCSENEDCLLFVAARIHGYASGFGAIHAQDVQVKTAIETDSLSLDGVTAIARAVPSGPELPKLKRLAARKGTP
jgi:hypothetical protein